MSEIVEQVNTEKSSEKVEKTDATKELLNSEKKWGKKVMSHNYTMVPKLLLQSQKYLKLNSSEFLLLIHVIEMWWKPEDMPFPAVSTLADRLCLNDRQIRNILNSLEQKGLLVRIPRYNKASINSRGSNYFDLSGLVEKLQQYEKIHSAKKKEDEKFRKRKQTPAFLQGHYMKKTINSKKNAVKVKKSSQEELKG